MKKVSNCQCQIYHRWALELCFSPQIVTRKFVEVYVANYLVPSIDLRDGFQLAFACFYKMDYLLTWNCAHLANVHKQEHIRIINLRLALHTPAIITPLELLPEEV